MIGERTAEEVKIQIGTALPLGASFRWRSQPRPIAGLPRTIPITSSEVMEGDRGAPAARRGDPDPSSRRRPSQSASSTGHGHVGRRLV
jgi:hypothetical protein